MPAMTGENENNNKTGLEIAVIGIVGRFPGARHLDEFWENIKSGEESVSHFTRQELLEYGVEPALLDTPNYIRAKGIMEDIEVFDARFFGYNQYEAQRMDPQIRIIHECAWHVLEDAGYDPDTYDGLIGLYAGASIDANWTAHSLLNQPMDNLIIVENALIGCKDFLSTLVSYRLNLRGPSYMLYTSCSTSLVATHLACRSLLTGECDIALACGITVTLPKKSGYFCKEGMAYSTDGHIRPFDEKANGTLFGDGVGMVALKRLEDALADGDRIHAVIKSSAVNNDGRRKVGYVAPSSEGQEEVIKNALYLAEIEPETIGYVEAHGTGTLVGDPLEVQALINAFNTDKRQYCAIGTVKANVGHLHAAAGTAGLIKAILAIKHKTIPPLVNFDRPNPKIDFENSPFYVNKEPLPWKSNGAPLRAGVSSFGIGGTNAHLILEEAPAAGQSMGHAGNESGDRSYQLILLSAKTESSLFRAAENLADYVRRHPEIDLPDIAYTLQKGRRAFQYRKMLVCSDTRELIEHLSSVGSTSMVQTENNPVIFMFSGHGSEYVNMGLELYCGESYFRKDIDRCFALLETIIGSNIKDNLYPAPWGERPGETGKIKKNQILQTRYTSSIKFIFDYCLARLIVHWGIQPGAMIGHSFGEYVAACLAGVFTLEDALKLLVLRGKLFENLDKGTMMRVFLSEVQIKEQLNVIGLTGDISLAAVNMQNLCVVSGTIEAIDGFARQLDKDGHRYQKLWVQRAGHSKMVEPIMKEFQESAAGIQRHKPKIPYISGLTGTWITPEQATDPAYYSRHMRETIRFFDGLTQLFKKENAIFVQIGCDLSLANFVKKHPDKGPENPVLNLIQYSRGKAPDVKFLLEKIGLLWLHGCKPDWNAFYNGEKRCVISLPGYAFDPTPYLSKAFYSVGLSASPGEIITPQQEEKIPSDLKTDAPAVFIKRQELKIQPVAPRDEIEQAIAEVWQNCFGLQQVSIHDGFFELGGDSLLAVQVVRQINQRLNINVPLTEMFINVTIAELAQYIRSNPNSESNMETSYPQVTPDPQHLHIPFPLTNIQMAYLIGRSETFEMGGVSTHGYQELETHMDIRRLNESINKVIHRHPMLRAVIIGGEQMILKEVPEYHIQVDDLSHLDEDARQQRILQERERMAHFIFQPDQWPLFEIKAFKLSIDTHYLCIGIDVLFSDGASLAIIARDLLAFYESQEDQLPDLEFSFRDYMLAYEELRETELYQRDKEYWLNKLEDFPSSPALPFKCSPSNITAPHFNRCHRKFSTTDWEKLKKRAKDHNITPSALLATAYAEVLVYWSNQPCLAFNLTLFNRFPFHKNVNQMVGDFTSLILLGLNLKPHTTFWEKAAEVQKVLFEALEHRHYDGIEFIRELSRFHGMINQVVVPIVFTSVLFSSEWVDADALNRLGEQKMAITQTSQAFIDFQASEEDGQLVINWDYVEDLFEEEVIHSMFEQCISIITALRERDDHHRPELRQEVLDMILHYNHTEADISPASLHRMFTDQAHRTPYHPAVEFGSDSITYRELDEQSNQVAHYLREKAVKPNQLVGVLTHRCIESIVNVLGILKAGGAYVPIDPDYPRDRQDYIYSNSKCSMMVTPSLYREENLAKYPTGVLNNINDLDSLAYVIYTSGSTGRPKGVMETHRQVSNTIIDINRKFQVNENDRVMAISSMCFDLSVYDVFGSLSTGATLVLISSQKDVKEIIETLYTKKITIWNSVPAIMDMTVKNMDIYIKPGGAAEPEPDELTHSRDSIRARLQVETAENTPAVSRGKIYYWSPAVTWKIKGNRLCIDKHYFSGAVLEVFPEFYFLTQDGAAIHTIVQHFPRVNASQLKLFINQLIEKRILVDSILSPQEVFHPQAKLFKSRYTEEILYNEDLYNEFKEFQVTRTFPGANKGKISLKEAGQFPSFITGRRSYREFDQTSKIPFSIFSTLLSIFKQIPGENIRYYYYASAGGLYPIDVFVYIKEDRVEQMTGGLYYYNPMDNSLNLVEDTGGITDEIHYIGNKEIFNASAASIFMIYDAGVTMPKYGENGYFFACLDSGVMVGTLTQAAELLGIGLCSIGHVNFQRIRDHFQLNENQVLIHTIEVGLKPSHVGTGISKEITWDIKENPGEINLNGTAAPGLRLVLLSGDWIPLGLPGKIWKYFPRAEVISLGGATEGSIWSIYYPVTRVKDTWKSIPYGYPLANQGFYVLNYHQQLCPPGVAGELYIGGSGVASGYLNDVEKTRYSFIHHPHWGNLYRTGDYGIFHKEGYIEFLGRRDQQVKIKGYRIELGEIENQLLGQEGVKEAIVLLRHRENGEKYLCAYLVAAAADNFTQQLRTKLSQTLPEYMIPTFFILLDQIPLTSNGKVNRKELPDPEEAWKNSQDTNAYAAPETETEKTIVDICSEVVQLSRIGIYDNFFELGINSLHVAEINKKLRETFKIHLPIIKMFEFSTVNALAEYINFELESAAGEFEAAPVTIIGNKPSQAQTMDRGKNRIKQRRKKIGEI
jgi:SagB-type dehydrogenase family enzyme